jgi:hypothetical protein
MAGRITPMATRITPVATGIIPVPTRNTPLTSCITPVAKCVTPVAMRITPKARRITPVATGVMRVPSGVSPELAGVMREPAEVFRVTTGVMAAALETSPRRRGVSSGGRRVVPADLPVDRGDLAGADGLDAEAPFADQILEDPVEGAAVRLVAERLGEVAARERLGKVRQRGADLVFQLSGTPAPGPARRRGRLLLRRRRCRSGLRGDEGFLLSGLRLEHPDQLESPDLGLVGVFQQLDSGAELLLQPPLVLFVLIVCHGVHNHNTKGRGRRGLHRQGARPC